MKARVWRSVRIPYSSLVRKNFSFYASKKKFKRLRYCRSVIFVDDTTPPHGTSVSNPQKLWLFLIDFQVFEIVFS